MLKFDVCIWAKQGEFGIRPICSVEETLDFLEEWPGERGPFYYVAANSAAEAMQGSVTPGAVKASLLQFLEEAEALGEEKMAD